MVSDNKTINIPIVIIIGIETIGDEVLLNDP